MHDIFISYSHDDKVTADAICSKLEQAGIRCWYAPRDASFGDAWAGSIVNAINNAKGMVLVFTEFSNASVQVRKEVTLAVNGQKVIIPFRATNTMPTESMEYLLCDLHWLDAYNDSIDSSLNLLLERVKAIVPAAAPIKVSQTITKTETTVKTVVAGKEYDKPLEIKRLDFLCETLAEHQGETYKDLSKEEQHAITMKAIHILAVAKGMECEFRQTGTIGRTVDLENMRFGKYCPAIKHAQIELLQKLGWKNGPFDLQSKTMPLKEYADMDIMTQDLEEIKFTEAIDKAGYIGYTLYYPLNDEDMVAVNACVKKIIEESTSRNELWRRFLPYLDLPGMEQTYYDAMDELETKIELGFV